MAGLGLKVAKFWKLCVTDNFRTIIYIIPGKFIIGWGKTNWKWDIILHV